MRWPRTAIVVVSLLTVLSAAARAYGFDSELTFHKGAFVLSGEGSYGWQVELEPKKDFTTLEFYDVGARFSLLPFDSLGKGSWWYGTFELGLEPLYQKYTLPKRRFWAGLSTVVRYHFLGLGRFVPYVEVAGSAGGTDLRLPEIRSRFAFLIFGGFGASVFLDNHTAIYGGYRWQHVSNGNTSRPNRGFESNVAVLGISYFF
jgi:hypothetical protein